MALKLTAMSEVSVPMLDLKSRLFIKFPKLNWLGLLQWAEKYGPFLFIPVVLDLIAGNIAGAIVLAEQQGPQCVADLLAALGLTPAPVTP